MKQYNESQYDDDLTVGSDDYDDSSYSDPVVDLFEFSTSEEAPISRLKSLILSIDWEITDEVLLQFNEELNDLKGIWAGEKINLVYVQALEKISKYIFQHKADSHPNAIKLLLTLYYNLEKIVSSEDIQEAEKKALLVEDVKKFEALKKHIAKQSKSSDHSTSSSEMAEEMEPTSEEQGLLFNLKAIVYAIDWEITDKDLDDLREEVVNLEKSFVDSKPRLILLQGIGTLGVYIKVKKSDAHADAFKLLHLFYESLEKIVDGNMNFEDEKAVLLPAVKDFNAFKAMLGSTISPEKVRNNEDEGKDDSASSQGAIAPAFSDISAEESKGFQAEEEAQSIEGGASTNVVNHIDDFFGDSVASPGGADGASAASGEQTVIATALQGVNVEEDGEEDAFGEVPAVPSGAEEEDTASIAALSKTDETPVDEVQVDREIALQGVDVETEADDDSDEEVLPQGADGVAPALVANNEEASAFSENNLEDPAVSEDDVFSEISGTLDGFFGSDDAAVAPPTDGGETPADAGAFASAEEEADVTESEADNLFGVDRNIALQGVDVESEADDDSDEEALPFQAGALAPALADNDEVSTYNEATIQGSLSEDSEIQQISGKLDGFFGEDEATTSAGEVVAEAQIDDESLLVSGESMNESAPEETSAATEVVSQPDEKQEEEITIDFSDSAVKEENAVAEELDDFFDDSVLEEGEKATVVTETESIDESIEVELSDEPDITETVPVEDEVVSLFEVDEEEDTEAVSKEILSSTVVEEATQSIDLPGTTTMPTNEQSFVEKEVVFELADEHDEVGAVEAVKSGVYMPPKVKIKPTLPGPSTAVKGSVADEILPSSQPFDTLCSCVDAFEIELDDRCFDEFNKELNSLNQTLTEKPIEKTFLQLLSTVVLHMDHFRSEADGESIEILRSVSKVLADLREGELAQNQKLLMAETVKVLEWQQGLITNAAANRKQDIEADTVASKDTGEPESSGDVASELVALRSVFKTEIAELRTEIKELMSS